MGEKTSHGGAINNDTGSEMTTVTNNTTKEASIWTLLRQRNQVVESGQTGPMG